MNGYFPIMRIYAFLILCLTIYSCSTTHPALDCASGFDINRYTGTWYEIARLPNRFEKGLSGVQANYQWTKDSTITVINSGVKSSGKKVRIEGVAFIPDSKVPAKLRVSFFRPFYSDYWVLAIDQNYESALIGEPGRNYLWILSRTPQMNEATYKTLVQIAARKGFDTKKLERISQP